jgi:hypothetical protein
MSALGRGNFGESFDRKKKFTPTFRSRNFAQVKRSFDSLVEVRKRDHAVVVTAVAISVINMQRLVCWLASSWIGLDLF